MIGSNECFKKGNCVIANICIKHRHLGINLIFTSQNPRSINNIIRNNIDIWALYKFSNIKMILEKVYDEVSNIVKLSSKLKKLINMQQVNRMIV